MIDYAGIGYQYQYCKAATVGTPCSNFGDWTTIPTSNVGTTSYPVPGLDNGAEYYFQMRSISNADIADPLGEVSAATTRRGFGGSGRAG